MGAIFGPLGVQIHRVIPRQIRGCSGGARCRCGGRQCGRCRGKGRGSCNSFGMLGEQREGVRPELGDAVQQHRQFLNIQAAVQEACEVEIGRRSRGDLIATRLRDGEIDAALDTGQDFPPHGADARPQASCGSCAPGRSVEIRRSAPARARE